jgi:hypothetical protein
VVSEAEPRPTEALLISVAAQSPVAQRFPKTTDELSEELEPQLGEGMERIAAALKRPNNFQLITINNLRTFKISTTSWNAPQVSE